MGENTAHEIEIAEHYEAICAAKDREIAELNKRIDALIDQRNEASTLQFAEMRKHDVTKFERDEARECVKRLCEALTAIRDSTCTSATTLRGHAGAALAAITKGG